MKISGKIKSLRPEERMNDFSEWTSGEFNFLS